MSGFYRVISLSDDADPGEHLKRADVFDGPYQKPIKTSALWAHGKYYYLRPKLSLGWNFDDLAEIWAQPSLGLPEHTLSV